MIIEPSSRLATVFKYHWAKKRKLRIARLLTQNFFWSFLIGGSGSANQIVGIACSCLLVAIDSWWFYSKHFLFVKPIMSGSRIDVSYFFEVCWVDFSTGPFISLKFDSQALLEVLEDGDCLSYIGCKAYVFSAPYFSRLMFKTSLGI